MESKILTLVERAQIRSRLSGSSSRVNFLQTRKPVTSGLRPVGSSDGKPQPDIISRKPETNVLLVPTQEQPPQTGLLPVGAPQAKPQPDIISREPETNATLEGETPRAAMAGFSIPGYLPYVIVGALLLLWFVWSRR